MMKKCAWCNMDIMVQNNIERESAIISHGICDYCATEIFATMGTELKDFLNYISAPTAVVDQEGVIKTCNQNALKIIQKDYCDIEGFRGGEVFECVYSRLPEGCGRTIHCSGCTIRRAVMETFETGKSLLQVPAYLNRGQIEDICEISMLISTEKIKDVVLLRIDKVNNKQVA